MAATLAFEPAILSRFSADLDRLTGPDQRLGLAVSGGPDSLALLLLAAVVRPARVDAVTVDHALRPESRSEAEMVAGLCDRLDVPHAILTAEWKQPPETAVQERARSERYRLLDRWAGERGLGAIATGHHADDQAETLLMRLARGAGVRGLAGMRAVAPVPGGKAKLVRPLLSWRQSELEKICADAGIEPVRDPSNADEQYERVRIRKALAEIDWLDAEPLSSSAGSLAAADAALHWATDIEWERQVRGSGGEIVYRPEAPFEIRRRIVGRVIAALASEGGAQPLRGREVDRLMRALRSGGKATLRGVLCTGGDEWRFSRAPRRRT